MIYRICITGTESTGKSTLAEKLSIHYKTIHVPDYSRYYIGQLDRPYNRMDVLEIAQGIIEQEDRMVKNANAILFSDNDLLNIKIWLRYYKWDVPQWLLNEITKRKSDLYLLCDIDLAWVADAQRHNPGDRNELFSQFKNELLNIQANYKLVQGLTPQLRLAAATEHINALFGLAKS